VARQPELVFERYVFDASGLIQLGRLRALRHLRPPGPGIVVPHQVALEVRKGRRCPAKTWLERYPETVTRFATPAESSLYLALLQQRDPTIHEGEAAAISIAAERGGTVVIRDRAAEAKAREHGVECLTADEFLAKWPHKRR